MLKRALVALALAFTATPALAETVTLAWGTTPQTPQIDVAIDKGLFKAAGLDVKVISFPTGREGFEALLGGQVDFAFMAEYPAVTGVLRNQSFGVVADLARYRGSRVIASAKKLPLNSLSELDGKKVGTTLGTASDFFTRKLLASANAKAEVINAAPSDLLPALIRGDVDAIVPFPSFYAAAKTALGDDYRELVSTEYVAHSIIAASGPILSKKPDTVKKFVEALVKADEHLAADPVGSADLVARNLKSSLSTDAVKALWKDYDFRVRLDDSLLTVMTEQGEWIVERGTIKAAKPTVATFRPYLIDAPLRAIKSDAVALP